MKKILIFAVLLVPSMSFAVPSVRTLGNNSLNTPKLIAGSGNKVTPTKTTQEAKQNSNVSTVARLGALRSKTKTSGVNSVTTNSGTRFPTISTATSYSSVATPKSGKTQDAVPANTTNVDTDAIVNAVMQKVERNYYNKADVYTNTAFEDAVKDTMSDVDDPRIDAIKVGSKPVHTTNLPSDYVYIWIEE
jgi:hypothetical protein